MFVDTPASSPRSDRPLCLVTGGNAGLGFELARAFAQAGCDIVLAGSDLVEQELAAAELEALAPDCDIQCLGIDLTRPQGPSTLYRKLRGMLRPLDILVANASVGAWGDFGSAATLVDELALAQANTLSLVHLTRLAAADMHERGYGQILMATSRSGRACIFDTVQEATRAFAEAFADGLAHELEGDAPNVSTLAPEVDIDDVCSKLRDPEELDAAAREATAEAIRARREAPLELGPLTLPDRIQFLFGGTAEIPTA